jgi:hypothetical protein
MIKKGIIWFLILAFLNFIIVPDYVFAGEPSMPHIDVSPSPSLSPAAVIGGVVLLVLVITGIVYLVKKHPSKPTEQPKDPNAKISSVTNLDEQLITPPGQISLLHQEQKQDTEISLNTNFDNQLITPSGEIVLVRW